MQVTFHGEGLPSSREYDITGSSKATWHIPEEVPVAFVFNKRNYAIMMATPEDLADFAIGFSFTENIIQTPQDILSLDIYQSDKGVDFRFKLISEVVEKIDILQRRRNLIGSASCGLCGLENADVLFHKLTPVSDTPLVVPDNTINKALSLLKSHQPLNQLTRTVHAAAWVDMEGQLKAVREDVGRHNALDKLLGALALDNTDMSKGFVIMSSRCSYEIVEKAASRGVKAIVSVSAPTAFALRKAKEAHMAVYSQSESGVARLL